MRNEQNGLIRCIKIVAKKLYRDKTAVDSYLPDINFDKFLSNFRLQNLLGIKAIKNNK